jgi:hypothetical protein
MNLDYIKKTVVDNCKMDVVEMKEWHGMDRQGYFSNTSTRFMVDKSLDPLENKSEKVFKEGKVPIG